MLMGLAVVYMFLHLQSFKHGGILKAPEVLDLPLLNVQGLLTNSLNRVPKKEKSERTFQDAKWESTHDEVEDYQKCAMNKPYPRPTHGCAVDRETHIPYCSMVNLMVDFSRIQSALESGGGEEDLLEIQNRSEEVEYLRYDSGAFVVPKPLRLEENMNRENFFYLDGLLMAMQQRKTASTECSFRYAQPTLFITRYEYVDLFHTVRDWWNAFFSLSSTASVRLDHQVVFLDAHAQGQYDEVWETLFGKTHHVLRLSSRRDHSACFNQAIFVPPGYSSVLWPRHRIFSEKAHRCPAMTKAFQSFVLEKHLMDNIEMQKGFVLIAERTNDEMRHPRSNVLDETGVVKNWDMVEKRIGRLENVTSVQVVNLERLPFMGQLRLIRQAHIFISNDENMLSHILFLHDGAHVLDMSGNSGIGDYAPWNHQVEYRDVGGVIYDNKIDTDGYENILESVIKDILTPDWDNATDWAIPNDDGMWNSGDGNFLFQDMHYSSDLESPQDYRDCTAFQPRSRPPHGCVVGGTRGKTTYCHFSELVVDTTKIKCPAGGEEIDSVLGRDEDDEYPTYVPGAFMSTEKFSLPDNVLSQEGLHYIRHVVGNITQEDNLQCESTESVPTMLLTRYEYVDLFVTILDWWDTFLMMPYDKESGQQIIFLDGHAKGVFDPVWERLFGQVKRINEISSTVCYENAALVPPAYSSMLRDSTAKGCLTLTNAFVDFVVDRMDVTHVTKERGKVVILDTKPFRSHPRLDLDAAKQYFTNLEAVGQEIQKSVQNVTVEVLRLDETDFETQLRAIRSAHILVGHQETGLAHLLFLSDETHIVELEVNGYTSSMQDLSSWKANVTHRVVHVERNDDNELPLVALEEDLVPMIEMLVQNRTVPIRGSDRKSGQDDEKKNDLQEGDEKYEEEAALEPLSGFTDPRGEGGAGNLRFIGGLS